MSYNDLQALDKRNNLHATLEQCQCSLSRFREARFCDICLENHSVCFQADTVLQCETERGPERLCKINTPRS